MTKPTVRQVAKSKTMWLAATLAALSAVQTALPDVQNLIPEGYYGLAGLIVAVAMGVIRVFTDRSLAEK